MKIRDSSIIKTSEYAIRNFIVHKKNMYQLLKSMIKCNDSRMQAIVKKFSKEYGINDNDIFRSVDALEQYELSDLIQLTVKSKNQDMYKELNQILTHELCESSLINELYNSDGMLSKMIMKKDIQCIKCYQDDTVPVSLSAYDDISVFPKLSKEEYSKVYVNTHMDNQEFIDEMFESITVEEVIYFNKRGGYDSNTNISLFILAYAESLMSVYIKYVDEYGTDTLSFNIFMHYIISISTITLDIISENFITSVINDVWLIIIETLPFILTCMRKYVENDEFDLSLMVKMFHDEFGNKYNEELCLKYISEEMKIN